MCPSSASRRVPTLQALAGHGPEQGIALVVTVMAMLLLSTIGAALVLTTSADALIAENAAASTETFYAAEAALERAVAEVQRVPDFADLLEGVSRSLFVDGGTGTERVLPGGIRIDLDEVVNEANCHQPTACSVEEMHVTTRDRPWGSRNPQWRLFAYGPLDSAERSGWNGFPVYAVVLIADDPSETDADPAQDGAASGTAMNPGAGVMLLRADAFGRRGSHRVVEATVIRHDLAARARWAAAEPATRGDPPSLGPFLQMLDWREVR